MTPKLTLKSKRMTNNRPVYGSKTRRKVSLDVGMFAFFPDSEFVSDFEFRISNFSY